MGSRSWPGGHGSAALVLVALLASSPLTAFAQGREAAASGAAPAVADTAAPAGGYSQKEVEAAQTADEAKVRELRNQEITQLRITLGRREPGNRRADLYYRLAELYLEAYRAEFLLEGRVHESRRQAGKDEKFINRARSRSYLQAGVRACSDIVALGIPFDKLDRVYYFLGVNYQELDRPADALHAFEVLTRKFPNSPVVADAYRELGDSAMSRKDYPRAQAYYELSASHEKGDARPRVLHKLAWTYYKTRQFERAVSTMKEAIGGASQSGEKLLSLKEEALRDMAIFMTETGRVEDALELFGRVAGDKNYYPRTLERLGRQYERNVQVDKATRVYETLLRTRPSDEAAFRVLVKLFELDLHRGKKLEALKRLEGVVIPEGRETETRVAAQNLQAMVRRTATDSHELYRNDEDRQALAVAEQFYMAYLNLFLVRSDPRAEIPEIRMYLAEVKRELGKSKEASALYRQVVESGDSRYAKEAGALWTASLSEAIRKASSAGGPRGGAEPSALEKEFIEASDRMQPTLGAVAEGLEAALKAAQVQAGYPGTRNDALLRARQIVERAPGSPQAKVAARLAVQIDADRLPEPQAAESLQKTVTFLRGSSVADDKLKVLLSEMETRLKVGSIAQAEKRQDFATAAQGYEEFARTSPQKDLAEKAFGSALSAYVKVHDFDSAQRVGAAWLKRFKDSRLAGEAIKSAATASLIEGSYEGAASLFEIGGLSGSSPESLDTSGRIRLGLGDSPRARQVWQSYLKLYPRSTGRFDVALRLGQAAEAEGRVQEALAAYRECQTGPHDDLTECGCRIGDLLSGKGDKAGAKKAFQKVAQAHDKQLSPFVGYARYRLAEMTEEGASFAKLQLPDAQFKKALNQRLAFLQPLTRAYQSAGDVGGPWGVAALDRLANWVLRFTVEVDAIAPPEGASPQAVAQFMQGLASISGPLRKKAVETWWKAYQNAVQGEILSPALPGIADRLADAALESPGSGFPARAQGMRGGFRLAGVAADGGAEGRQGALLRVRSKLQANPQDAPSWVDYGNLLWGEGKPLLSRLAYDRALALDPRHAPALNNRGVVIASGVGQEDWYRVNEGYSLFRQALLKDESFLPARMNRALLLNYYRLFRSAKPLWETISARTQAPEARDGLAVALQGLGQGEVADGDFKRATDQGLAPRRFTRVYHSAAFAFTSTAAGSGPAKCLSLLEEMGDASLGGFERESFETLKRTCKKWKSD